MSWIQKLYETYENCSSMIGKIESDDQVPLLPICHTTNKAQIEIVIDGEGNFKRAQVVPKDQARTIIPCTEASGGRASGEAPHPLCDKLQYVAADYKKYGGEKESYFKGYYNELKKWSETTGDNNPKAASIFKYISKGNVIADLVKHEILIVANDARLIEKPKVKAEEMPEIFKVLNDQLEAFVRWEVEISNEPCSRVWEDVTLWDSWEQYYLNTKKEKAFCYVSGEQTLFADQHPAKLRNDGDKAKLISSNDMSGFTFRGRFTEVNQACSVSYSVTQKAHSALRWLISRQGYRNGDMAVVAWAVSGAPVPSPLGDPLSIFGETDLPIDEPFGNSTAQYLAIKLKNKIAGYKAELGDTTGVVVMGLDSATPGRMAITFYRELTGSDFLKRLNRWHESCAWIHDYRFVEEKQEKKVKRKYIRFVGASPPKDIAEAAYGVKCNDKLKKATVERILPCIIDGRQIPRDIVDSAVRRACNRVGLEHWEWNKVLSIACALFRKLNEKEGYNMALDESRNNRDYLYGRLLAVAEHIESRALYISGETRDTTAAKLMQRFSDKPFSTWKTIEEALTPYKTRLQVKRPAFLHEMKSLLDIIHGLFQQGEYENNQRLSGEYLLGYHCQREKLMTKVDTDKVEIITENVA